MANPYQPRILYLSRKPFTIEYRQESGGQCLFKPTTVDLMLTITTVLEDEDEDRITRKKNPASKQQ